MLVEPHDSGWLCFLGAMGAAGGLSVRGDGWGVVLEGWEVPTHQRAHGAGGSRLGAGHVTCLPPKEGGLEMSFSLPPPCRSASWAPQRWREGAWDYLSLPCSSL